MTVNPIHTEPDVQHVDVRMYFPRDLDRDWVLNCISSALQSSPEMAEMVSAYELVNDGFANFTPADEALA